MTDAACRNAELHLAGTGATGPRSEALELVETAIENESGILRVRTVSAYFEGTLRCTLILGSSPAQDAEIGEVAFEDDGFIDGLAPFWPFMLHAPDTAIAALATAPARTFDGLRRTLLDSDARPYAPGAGDSCWLPGDAAVVANVSEFVNLRAGTGFSARILREVPLGASLTLVSNPLAAGTASDREACAKACRAAANGPETPETGAAVRACIARSAVWYKVRDGEGTEGYVSRKFLKSP